MASVCVRDFEFVLKVHVKRTKGLFSLDTRAHVFFSPENPRTL